MTKYLIPMLGNKEYLGTPSRFNYNDRRKDVIYIDGRGKKENGCVSRFSLSYKNICTVF